MRPSVIAHAVHAVILTWRVGPVGSSLESQYRGTLRPAKQNHDQPPRGCGAHQPHEHQPAPVRVPANPVSHRHPTMTSPGR